ncbi:LPXTG cell wall anchor domain-containing protein [Listeria monocytogenes]|nr:LPXTG cell wall anchor domain-containing protein [Listeria monocytogenes]
MENLTNLTNLDLHSNQIRDISALKKLDNPNLKLDVSNQLITNSPIDYISTMIEIENSIRDVENISVAPTIISNNGSYDGDSNKVTWPMPSYLASVNYTFSKTFTFGSQNAIFSGRVIQPLNRVSFIATFDVDGKTSSRTVAYNNAVPQPADPVKAGYTFKGWYTTKTGGDKWDFVNDKMPARDITLYAQFTVNSYQATFDVDGKTSSETVAYNNAVPQPADPVKAGYTFKGWYTTKTGGDKWDFVNNKMPARDITLYAQFAEILDVPPESGIQSPSIPDKTYPQKDDIQIKIIKQQSNPKQIKVKQELPKTGDSYQEGYILLGIFFMGIAAILIRRILIK